MNHFDEELLNDSVALKASSAVFDQEEYLQDVCNLVAATGISFYWVENPETQYFMQKYIPAANPVLHGTLSGCILDKTTADAISKTCAHINGKQAMIMADGWKNNSDVDVFKSTIMVDGIPYLLRTHDMSSCPKTGDEAFGILQSDIEYAEETYQVKVIGCATDNGPDCKKAHWLLAEAKAWLATFVCWGHQDRLMTRNYLAVMTTYSYSTYTEEQRLSTHLPDLGKYLESVITFDEDKLVEVAEKSQSEDATARCLEAIESIKKPMFWKDLKNNWCKHSPGSKM
ncbi:hypothetical protein BT96DRAFT_949120 [Gymnopus androsaceus JB14]|uniref:DUF659 domain-containing protein n=1 Tax=Gymnopus androsaceus JB14 TaxID=1447944 RepID=A0A6A4GMK6_9AGAR|nr:hypothetical protein BT96DRAFT_949120 [Gymnopus androsaceus JB14]